MQKLKANPAVPTAIHCRQRREMISLRILSDQTMKRREVLSQDGLKFGKQLAGGLRLRRIGLPFPALPHKPGLAAAFHQGRESALLHQQPGRAHRAKSAAPPLHQNDAPPRSNTKWDGTSGVGSNWIPAAAIFSSLAMSWSSMNGGLHLVTAEVLVVQPFQPAPQLFVVDLVRHVGRRLGRLQHLLFDVDRAIETQG